MIAATYQAPTVEADPGRAERLVKLADRMVSLARLQAQRVAIADEANEAYWRDTHGGYRPSHRQPCDLCDSPESGERWSAYCDLEHKADRVRRSRERTYRSIVKLVIGALEDAGIEPPDRVTLWERSARALAVVRAGDRTFTMVGGMGFYEDPCDGWDEVEVLIGD